MPRWRCTASNFQPSRWLDAPYAMVTVNAVVADTDERAAYLAKPGLLAFLRLRAGRPEAMDSPEVAAGYRFDAAEEEFAADRRVGQALGSPDTVRRQLARPAGAHPGRRADDHLAGVRHRGPGAVATS